MLQDQEAKDLLSTIQNGWPLNKNDLTDNVTIQNGWPLNKNDLTDNVKPYFSFRDTLSCEDGCVFKGERIFVPQMCRNVVKTHLHRAHLDYSSMMRRAPA